MAGEVDWPRLVIGMLGGDKREQEIARLAAATGAQVRAHGFPWPEQGIPGVRHLKDPAEVLKGARFALFPIPGIAASGAARDLRRSVDIDRLGKASAGGAARLIGRTRHHIAVTSGIRIAPWNRRSGWPGF